MKKYFKTLKKCPLFFGIEEENLEKMLVCLNAKVEFFDKKYTVINEGNPAKYIGIILSGSAQIIKEDYYGNRSILSNISSAEIFGEAFACAKIDSVPVSVIANEPSEIMLIDCNRILYTCTSGCDFHRQLIYNLMTDLANKTLIFHKKIEITSKRTTREKLMTYLMITAKENKSSSFYIPFNRQELADYLEVERSGLSIEISKLIKEKIINSKKNYFELL